MQFTSAANLLGWKSWTKDGKMQMLIHLCDLKAKAAEGNAPITLFCPEPLQSAVRTWPPFTRVAMVQEGDGKFNKLVSLVAEKVA